jgi:hypothetical protein
LVNAIFAKIARRSQRNPIELGLASVAIISITASGNLEISFQPFPLQPPSGFSGPTQ